MKLARRHKIMIAVPVAFFTLLLVFLLAGEVDSWIPSDTKLDDAASSIARAEKSYRALKAQFDTSLENEKTWKERSTHWFRPERDGDPELELRKKIEPAATKAVLPLNSIGTVRRSAINTQLYFAEIDVAGSGTLEQITAFLAEIQQMEPRLYWRRIELRPEFRRGPGPAAATAEPLLQINGTLRAIAFNIPEVKK